MPDDFIFGVFYTDLKSNKWAKLYTTNLLMRRILFCIIVIAFLREDAVFIVFSLMFLIQVAYFTQIVVIRPFKNTKHNLIETLNEAFILMCISAFFLVGDSSEEEWRAVMATAVLFSLVLNTVFIVIIEMGK